MPGIGFDDGFGVKGDTQSSDFEHGQIICSVADRDDLFEADVFSFGDLLQQFGLALAVDDLTRYAAGHPAILDFQFVGVEIVDAEFFLEVVAEVGETAGHDSRFIA